MNGTEPTMRVAPASGDRSKARLALQSFQSVFSALSFRLAHRENSIMTPKRLMQAITRARERRRAWIALVAGAVSALSQAPSYLWPILFLTFPLLVWLIDGA